MLARIPDSEKLMAIRIARVESPNVFLMWLASQTPGDVCSITSPITKVERTIISARLMNKGPTVPRTNRLKNSTGTRSGDAARLQNNSGCRSGENVTVSAVTG